LSKSIESDSDPVHSLGMKIALYMLCKNESSRIPQFIQYFSLFDEVVVLDTGSQDSSMQLLKNAGAKVFQKTYEPFDFAQARNDCLDFVSNEMDWCLYLDFNETLKGFDKEILSKLDSSVNSLVPKHQSIHDGVLVNGQDHKIRFHKRHGFRWAFAIHELIFAVDGFSASTIYRDDILITKLATESPEKDRFYHEIAVRAHQKNPTELHYLWFMLFYFRRYELNDDYITYGLQYLAHSQAYNNSFRITIFFNLAKVFLKKNDKDSAIKFALSGLSEALYFPPTSGVPQEAFTKLQSIGLQIRWTQN
jgi:glycosyltransferase involved in cell wall biosynthesis